MLLLRVRRPCIVIASVALSWTALAAYDMILMRDRASLHGWTVLPLDIYAFIIYGFTGPPYVKNMASVVGARGRASLTALPAAPAW